MSNEARNPMDNMYLRMAIYMLVTMLITLFSVLDSMDIEKIKNLTNIEWVKLVIKSSLPALISLKAYFDDSSVSNSNSNSEGENS
jgi:hypothetical protein